MNEQVFSCDGGGGTDGGSGDRGEFESQCGYEKRYELGDEFKGVFGVERGGNSDDLSRPGVEGGAGNGG